MANRPPLVQVVWDDAYASEEPDPRDSIETVSCGYLITRTPKRIQIAQSVYPPEYSSEDAREVLTLPANMVREVREVRSLNLAK